MPVYGYSFGVSLENTVVPGSIVAIGAELKNTGDAPIVFPTRFIGGMPSVQGGSVPSVTVGDRPGDWSLLGSGFNFGPTFGVSDLRTQFQGVTINPGETFSFTYATFRAPATGPPGSSAAGQLNFSIRFTDSISGNLLGISPFRGSTKCAPSVTFPAGQLPVSVGQDILRRDCRRHDDGRLHLGTVGQCRTRAIQPHAARYRLLECGGMLLAATVADGEHGGPDTKLPGRLTPGRVRCADRSPGRSEGSVRTEAGIISQKPLALAKVDIRFSFPANNLQPSIVADSSVSGKKIPASQRTLPKRSDRGDSV